MNEEETKKELSSVLQQIRKNKEIITIELYNKLSEISTKTGFFTKENRKEIWKYFLKMTSKQTRSSIYKTSNMHKRVLPSNISQDKIQISKDQNRCIFFQFEKGQTKVNPKQFVNQLTSFFQEKKPRFDYYQGFYDIAIYFGSLFYKKDNYSSNNFQFQSLELFTELYLMDYISPFPLNVNIFTVIIELLTEFIQLYDSTIGKFIQKDKENNNVFLFGHLSWIITYFTHDINKFDLIGRVMDYLSMHKLYTVYALSAVIICDHLQSIKRDLVLEKVHLTMKELNLNDVDFNAAIMKCEKLIKGNKGRIKRILGKYKEKGLDWCGDVSLKGTKSIVLLHESVMETVLSRFIRKYMKKLVFIVLILSMFIYCYLYKENILLFNKKK